MPYKNIVFAKLEKRLLNDWRWFTLDETTQLIYIKLILVAQETYNKIPKEISVLKDLFHTKLHQNTINKSIEKIKTRFPRFEECEEFYRFEDFESKTNYIREIPSDAQILPKVGIEKEKEKEKRKRKNFVPPTLEEVKNYIKEKRYSVNGDTWYNFYTSNGWMVGKNKMKDWKAAIRTWHSKEKKIPPEVDENSQVYKRIKKDQKVEAQKNRKLTAKEQKESKDKMRLDLYKRFDAILNKLNGLEKQTIKQFIDRDNFIQAEMKIQKYEDKLKES